WFFLSFFFFFKQKTAYDIGLGIPAEPLFRSTPSARNFFRTFSSASVRTSVFPARTRKVNANNSAALTGRSTPLIMFSVNSAPSRSEERRVGKECRSRCTKYHEK